MTWPVLVFWMLIVWGLASRRPVLLYLFFATPPFGSLAVIPVEMVGGVNLLPQAVCAAALLLRLALHRGALREGLNAMLNPQRLALLTGFLAVSVLVTAFTPRIFAGMVDVVSIAGALLGPRPLVAGMHNVTQTAYLALSVLTVVAFAVIVGTPARLVIVRHALLLGELVMAATGVLTIAADTLGLGELLSPFRTVSYVLLTEDEALGARRLAELMPEASAFGASAVMSGATLALLYPCFDGWRRSAAAATAITLFGLAAMSTASTAYIGLAAGSGLLGLNWLRRIVTRTAPRPTGGRIEFMVVTLAVTLLLGLLLFDPRPLAYASDMLDLMVFQKTTSASYLERMQWNETAIDGLMASFGLGVGLGSARASNWFVALASNTGVIGALLMLTFVAQTFLRRSQAFADPLATESMWALKIVLVVGLVLGATSGTSPDFGVGNAAIYGVIAGLAHRPSVALVGNADGRREARSASG